MGALYSFALDFKLTGAIQLGHRREATTDGFDEAANVKSSRLLFVELLMASNLLGTIS
jgi:hypothetical protein